MGKNILHITNGDSLTDYLKQLKIEGAFFTWREMLCEGPVSLNLLETSFAQTRTSFLKKAYPAVDMDYQKTFVEQFNLLDTTYDEIVLWFEYDLFCHINLLGALHLIQEKGNGSPLSLVCSGKVAGEDALKGLAQLTKAQLLNHYESRTSLTKQDLVQADIIWRCYCSDDHTKLTTEMARNTQFEYLSHCISAHKGRFPSLQNGLNTLETQLLKLIDSHQISSTRTLCGYGLSYQGYYGYGDIQMAKMIARLSPFYKLIDGRIALTRDGALALNNVKKFDTLIKNDAVFGGASKYAHYYNTISHELMKV